MSDRGDSTQSDNKNEIKSTESLQEKANDLVIISKLQPKAGLLIVKMYTPYKVFFEGYAKSVSALNETGAFDILPGHHNFISMLKPCDVGIISPGQPVRNIPISHGLMHVRNNKVIIFLDV